MAVVPLPPRRIPLLECLSKARPGDLIPLLAIAGGILIALTSIIANQWRRVRQAELQLRHAELEASLKQEMINRGMSVDEIRQVLEAKTSSSIRPADQKPLKETVDYQG
jgi:hypothetical protein